METAIDLSLLKRGR